MYSEESGRSGVREQGTGDGEQDAARSESEGVEESLTRTEARLTISRPHTTRGVWRQYRVQ